MFGQSKLTLYGERPDFHRLLDDAEERYSSMFQELGPDALGDLKRRILSLKIFISLLLDPEMDSSYKLKQYNKVKMGVFEFCGYYARWLGRPLMERLKSEIYEILEEAIDWWGQQEVCDEMEG